MAKSLPTASMSTSTFGAVADEVALPDRLGDLAVLDEVRLGHAEDEVAGGGVDLPAAQRRHVHAVVGRGHDAARVALATHQVGVGHPHHRQVLVALAPTVAGPRASLLAGPQVVPHVVGEDAVLDEDVALGGRALVVDGVAAPLLGHGPVVDERDQRRGHLLAEAALEHRGALVDQVLLQPVAAGLVEQHPAPTGGPMTTGSVPEGAGRAASLVMARRAGGAGDVLDLVAVEQLEPDGAPQRLVSGLHAGVAEGHRRHHEQGADLVVLGQQAVAVGHQDPAAGIAVAGPDLADRAALGPGGLVGPAEQVDLGALGDRLGEHGDLVGPGPPGA